MSSDKYVKEETLDLMEKHLTNVRKEFDIAYAFCELRERLKEALND